MIDWGAQVLAPTIKVFGQPGTLTQGGVSVDLNGIFDEAYVDVDVLDGMQTTSTKPCFGIDLVDLPFAPAQGARVFIPAALGAPLVDTTYIVKKVQKDGHGGARLLLNVAPATPAPSP